MSTRYYDLFAVNERTGMTEKLNLAPLTHREAVVFRSKYYPRPRGAAQHVRIQIEPVGRHRQPSHRRTR